MHKSVVTSKGQLTIPKRIREYLNVSMGDCVIFKLVDNQVHIQKDKSIVECPVCDQTGFVTHGDESLTCFICDGTNKVEAEKNAWELVSSVNYHKHKIGLSIVQQEESSIDNIKIVLRDIPKVVFHSHHYPVDFLEKGNDYIQMQFIKEYSPKSQSNSRIFMIPSKIVLDDILGLLRQENSKEQVKEWFRF